MGVLRARVGNEWVDLTVGAPGPQGPPGPSGITTVSADPGNDLTTGTDGRIYYDADSDYEGRVPIFASDLDRDAAITAPVEGQMAYSQDTNLYSTWNGTAWIPMSSTPTGTVAMFGGLSSPTGWLLCQGQTLTTIAFPALFAAIAYNFGGSGPNFVLPDLRGRSPVGVGPSGQGNSYTMGQAWGNESVAIDLNQMPSHNHSGYTGAMDRDSGHTHGAENGGEMLVTSQGPVSHIGGLLTGGTMNSRWGTGRTDINHLHGIAAQGANQGHNTVHPVRGIHFIIKT
jgi:microcystin-dependent protein